MKRVSFLTATVLLIAAIVLATGCKDHRTMISSILQRPEDYIDREVVVGGDVVQSCAVNLIIAELGAYQVDDGTGKIWVLTKTGVPTEGTQVGVRGTVSGGVRMGPEMLGAVIREKDRRVQ